MSFVGSMFSDDNGSGFKGKSADIQKPVTNEQANQVYGQTQQGLAQQQAFLQALQGQNGIQNQSNVFNQLQGVANGTGSNPAQAMLANATGNNVANQAALMAGQRGSGANAGLIARQAAQMGANTQQQAVGQGAAMQANQSLGALGQLGGLASNQVAQQAQGINSYNSAAQGLQGNILSGIQGQNNATVANQSNQNNVNAGIAQGNQAFQQKQFGGAEQAAGGLAGLAHGGVVPHMADGGAVDFGSSYGRGLRALGGSSPDIGQFVPNGHLAEMQSNPMFQPGQGKPATPIADSLKAPEMAPQFSQPAPTLDAPSLTGAPQPAQGPSLGMPAFGSAPMAQGGNVKSDDGGIASLMSVAQAFSKGGKVPAMVSPGERYLDPQAVQEVAAGKKDAMEAGEKIPGKAKVKGAKDTLANDTVPKTLEEGGIVLPRSVTQSKHPHWAAHRFVSELMARNALKK